MEAARAIVGLDRTYFEAVLAKSRQPPNSTRIHLKADEWAHLPPADDRRQTLLTACKQRPRRKNWHNTQFLRINQLGLNPQISTPTSPSCEQLFILHRTSLTHPSRHHTSRQENDTIPAERPYASHTCLHPPCGHPNLH